MTNEDINGAINYLKSYRKLDENLHNTSPKDSVAYFATDKCLKYWDMAIKALETIPKYKDAYNKGWDDGAKASYEHLKMCEEEQSGDLVSRDAVLDIIHLFFTEEVDKIPTKKTEDGEVLIMCKAQPLFAMNKAICKRIKALPSVTAEEQEPCEDSNANQYNSNALNALEGDAISRQAVLDLIEHYNSDGLGSVFYGYEEGVKFADAVNKLPPVNPQEPKTEKVIKMRNATPEEREAIDKYIKSISKPTVVDFWDLEQEPKTGEWQQDLDGTFLCSECGSGFKEQPTLMGKPMFLWCPLCGARMESEEV